MEQKYKIHAFYIISILISIIVILISVKWSEVKGLIEYITFSLTLSSLLLAVLAIIYSIFSNSSLSKVIQNLHNSSDVLKNTSLEIDKSNHVLLSEIKKIPIAIESVESNLAKTHSLVQDISFKEHISVSDYKSDMIQDKVVMDYLENSSIRGLEALLCIVYSKHTGTSFSYDDITSEIEEFNDSKDYMVAYLISSSSFGLLSYKYDSQFRIVVEDINPVIINYSEQILSKKLDEAATDMMRPNEMSLEESKEHWHKPLKELKSYFGIRA